MQLISKYILKDFIKVFFLSVITFVALLLVIRAQEIAKFIALQSSPYESLLFIACQIPYILPFAIPISALIAAFIKMQKLSSSHELTALRVSGLSLLRINSPFLLIGCLLAALNFIMISELAPRSKFYGATLLVNKISANPLLLLKKSKLLKIKDTYVDLSTIPGEDIAEDAIFAYLSPSKGKIHLLLSESLEHAENLLIGHHMTLISTLSEDSPSAFDDVFIENHVKSTFDSSYFSYLVQPSEKDIDYDMLPTKMCRVKQQEEKIYPKSQKAAVFELAKRLFYIFLPITLTLIGISFSIQVGRQNRSNTQVFKLVGVTLIVFIGFFIGKSFHKAPSLSIATYILCHLLAWIFCIRSQVRVLKGLA